MDYRSDYEKAMDSLHEVEHVIGDLKEHVHQLNESKDTAYEERNKLVAVLSKLFPSHLTEHPADDPNWDRDWLNIVIIQFPEFQASWHLHRDHLKYFNHLKKGPNTWDGHSTEDKYENLQRFEPTR